MLAEALLADPSAALPKALQEGWQRQNTPGLALLKNADGLPGGIYLRSAARPPRCYPRCSGPARKGFKQWPDEEDNRRLLTTRDMREALGPVHKGLAPAWVDDDAGELIAPAQIRAVLVSFLVNGQLAASASGLNEHLASFIFLKCDIGRKQHYSGDRC